eukprot:COSAG01_NODE_1735_length_9365_cov_3.816318_11_plen_150_part_00
MVVESPCSQLARDCQRHSPHGASMTPRFGQGAGPREEAVDELWGALEAVEGLVVGVCGAEEGVQAVGGLLRTLRELADPVAGASRALGQGGGGGGGGGGESFLRVHWVAVPKAVRARRVNNRHCEAAGRAVARPRDAACAGAGGALRGS